MLPFICVFPTCFFSVAVSNGIFSLISVSGISLLVYKNAFDRWILTLYPVILPYSVIRLNTFLVDFTGFSMYNIMSSVDNDSFTSSFPIWMPFIYYYFFLFVWSDTMLNRSGKSGHPCPIPDLSGKAVSFYPLSMILAVSFSYMTFIMLPLLPLYWLFSHKWGCTLWNAFSISIFSVF